MCFVCIKEMYVNCWGFFLQNPGDPNGKNSGFFFVSNNNKKILIKTCLRAHFVIGVCFYNFNQASNICDCPEVSELKEIV